MDFSQSVDEWRDLGSRRLDEAELERLELLEARLLAHSPGTLAEAAAILDVLLSNHGERSDNQDRQALANVKAFLARLAS